MPERPRRSLADEATLPIAVASMTAGADTRAASGPAKARVEPEPVVGPSRPSRPAAAAPRPPRLPAAAAALIGLGLVAVLVAAAWGGPIGSFGAGAAPPTAPTPVHATPHPTSRPAAPNAVPGGGKANGHGHDEGAGKGHGD
jgi:hypothetical protein